MAAKSKNGLNGSVPKKETTAPSSVETEATPALAPKPLLTLATASSQRLVRTFQKLVGGSGPSKPEISEKTAFGRAFLHTLIELGFEVNLQTRVLTHPLAFERTIPLPVFSEQEKDSPEAVAMRFANQHLPELEFYLPYITLRAKVAASPHALLAPEPDYDEDGFLMD